MAINDVVNGIFAVEKKLQTGTNNLAHKANELAGLGNYQISTLFFGGSTAYAAYLIGMQMYQAINNPGIFPNPNNFMWAAIGIYQIWENKKLEKQDDRALNESEEALSIDLNIAARKKAFINWSFFSFLPAKGVYWFTFVEAAATLNPLGLWHSAGMLFGQYFRETGNMKPTTKNKLFDFFRNAIPAKLSPNTGHSYAGVSVNG